MSNNAPIDQTCLFDPILCDFLKKHYRFLHSDPWSYFLSKYRKGDFAQVDFSDKNNYQFFYELENFIVEYADYRATSTNVRHRDAYFNGILNSIKIDMEEGVNIIIQHYPQGFLGSPQSVLFYTWKSTLNKHLRKKRPPIRKDRGLNFNGEEGFFCETMWDD